LIDSIRFPSKLVTHYGVCSKIWLLARALDNSRDKFWFSQGCGIATLSIAATKKQLNRGSSTIYRYLAIANQKGLIRRYSITGDWVTIYYTSLENAALLAGFESIGPVSEIEFSELESLTVTATEVETAGLQRESVYAARLEKQERLKANNQGSVKVQMVDPVRLTSPPCGTPARVLGWLGQRWVCVSENFVVYGGSQKAIALRRGVSVRTVQRHLSNSYRLSPSPVRKCRAELAPIIKRQVAVRLPRAFKPLGRASRDSEIAFEEKRILKIGDRYFEQRANVYSLPHCLVPCKFRRRRFHKKNLSIAESVSPGLTEGNLNKASLSEEGRKGDPVRL
jgi:transposase